MLNYNYENTKAYCDKIGLVWLGDQFVSQIDEEAFKFGFTQEQFDAAFRQHLWQVRWLFTPQTYSYWKRILLALHFLFGSEPKIK